MMLSELAEEYDILKMDGMDDAIIGIDMQSMRLVYSAEKCIEILQRHMPYDQAVEYFDFNVRGAYVGDGTPIICDDLQIDACPGG